MSQLRAYANPYAVGYASQDTRARFVVRTYNHLVLAIAAFALIEVALFKLGIAPVIMQAMSGSWLLVLGGFILVSWLASRAAMTAQSMVTQYLALFAYVAVEALIFVPLLYVANTVAPGTISSAALVTFLGFAGLTAVAFVTKKDFSFLRGVILWGGIMAMVLVVAALIFGLQLGTFFSVAMVALAGASILYDTSNVLRVFPEDRYVAAALQLFASVALLFWYVLRLFLNDRR